MTTAAQIASNRRNCLKSTGPKSPEGKSAISKNAVKHGLTASQSVIAQEDQAEFELYRQQFLAELDPESPVEFMLAERIVSLSWRLMRANLFQNQTIDELSTRDKYDPLKGLADSMLKRLTKNVPPEPAPDLPLGRLAVKDFSSNRVLERLLLYERRMEHSLYKTLLEYQRLHLIRTLNNDSINPLKQLNW